jgi:hypothetical protein
LKDSLLKRSVDPVGDDAEDLLVAVEIDNEPAFILNDYHTGIVRNCGPIDYRYVVAKLKDKTGTRMVY